MLFCTGRPRMLYKGVAPGAPAGAAGCSCCAALRALRRYVAHVAVWGTSSARAQGACPVPRASSRSAVPSATAACAALASCPTHIDVARINIWEPPRASSQSSPTASRASSLPRPGTPLPRPRTPPPPFDATHACWRRLTTGLQPYNGNDFVTTNRLHIASRRAAGNGVAPVTATSRTGLHPSFAQQDVAPQARQ
jgi:hypothetical protein